MSLKYFFTAVLFLLHTACAQNYQLLSPDGRLKVTITLDEGRPFYQVERSARMVIEKSRLGLLLKNKTSLAQNLEIISTETAAYDETWSQPWGEVRDIRNNYNQLRIDLASKSVDKEKIAILFRVFNDGVGFRYQVPQQAGLTDFEIIDEISEFHLTADHKAWWIEAYQDNRYEYLYQSSPLSTLDTVHTPLTMEATDGLCISIHEAALLDYPSMTLANSGNNILKADLVPWSDGVKVKTSAPMQTPWRTIQIADTPGGLITSYLILNLNEPNKLQDISWVKPGKYVGIWWEMHLATSTWGQGDQHGATTANTKRYMDFAAKHGFDGVLVEGWNLGWDGDWIRNGDKFNFTEAYDDFDINEVARYGAEKGVRLIGHNETGGAVLNYEAQLSDAFALYNSLGVRAVKTGYVNYGRGIKRLDENGKTQGEYHHGQFMVRHYNKVMEEAAKYQIMLDVHEPVKDTGLRRTYPNMMTREGARGQEFNAWSADGGNPPEHETILPFTRLLAGPMDFTPGIFDLLFEKEKPDNRVNTTLAKQLALYVVLYSPLQMAADLPQNYEKNPAPFQFILDVPADWQETKILHAAIGDYITTVRKDRNGNDWYLGSITDENSRVLAAPLAFLDAGIKYQAEIYRDAVNADWKTNPYGFEIEKQIVDSNTILELYLAPGGGTAVRFTPLIF